MADEKAYASYVTRADSMEQDEVDEATIGYLRIALANLKVPLRGNVDALRDIDRASAVLSQFVQIRTENNEVKEEDYDQDNEGVSQELADYLFSQVFKQLLSLMKSHRQAFIKSTNTREEE